MSRIKEKVNPEVEFTNDPMLKELHKIQIKISEQVKDMNGRQLSEYFRKKSEEFRKK